MLPTDFTFAHNEKRKKGMLLREFIFLFKEKYRKE